VKPRKVQGRRTPRAVSRVNHAAGLWLLGALIVVTLAAYRPVWYGGLLWDDDGHLTKPALQSAAGLWRIWFSVGATQQYYPVAHTAFWIFHRLWGDATLGYHLVNIALHATSAWLFVRLLQRLDVPGAWLAGFLFALHPLEVESVAWMSELKNTLSGSLYLAAALAYLRFDSTRARRGYGAAFVLFALAVLSKTVTVTLPAALLVVLWWRRGSLRLRDDVLPLTPFFALGVTAGLVTAWVERTQIGAEGAAFDFGLVERGLIAGRVATFYVAKLVWPADLAFIYPRWTVSAAAWWQYVFPAVIVGAVIAAWWWRDRSRTPLAVILLFVGTLFPALGFVNVYPFVFSFVADHFQYLAGLPILALVAAVLTRLARRLDLTPVEAAAAATMILITPAAVLTWQQSLQFVDAETLYRTTIDRNPSCWLAENNLGQLLHERARISAESLAPGLLASAVSLYERALRLNPSFAEAHNNLGSALLDLGRFDTAAAEYREAQRLKPDVPLIRANLGLVARKKGFALAAMGRADEAIASFADALEIDDGDAEAHGLLADALAGKRAFGAAVPHYREFLGAHPHDANGWTGLGISLASLGDVNGAILAFRGALAADPGNPQRRQNLARAVSDQLSGPLFWM
jgi:protein O-mannosyl-transferase